MSQQLPHDQSQITIVQGDQYNNNYSGDTGQINIKSHTKATATTNKEQKRPWISGSFYLVVFIVINVVLAIVARLLPIYPYAFVIVLVGDILVLSIIGAFTLRQDNRLSEENFLKLMFQSLRYVSFIKGREVKQETSDSHVKIDLFGLVVLVVCVISTFFPMGANKNVQELSSNSREIEIYLHATSGTPLTDDQLNLQGTSSSSGSCTFVNGAYQFISNSLAYPCIFLPSVFNNLAYQVQMTINDGDGGGGLSFRDTKNSWGYQFTVAQDKTELRYGQYGQETEPTILISSTKFKAKLHQPYLLTAIAQGSAIYVYISEFKNNQWVIEYVNQPKLNNVVDRTVGSEERIGLEVSANKMPTKVIFSNLKVWNLG